MHGVEGQQTGRREGSDSLGLLDRLPWRMQGGSAFSENDAESHPRMTLNRCLSQSSRNLVSFPRHTIEIGLYKRRQIDACGPWLALLHSVTVAVQSVWRRPMDA